MFCAVRCCFTLLTKPEGGNRRIQLFIYGYNHIDTIMTSLNYLDYNSGIRFSIEILVSQKKEITWIL